jgi:hypothetical protein
MKWELVNIDGEPIGVEIYTAESDAPLFKVGPKITYGADDWTVESIDKETSRIRVRPGP